MDMSICGVTITKESFHLGKIDKIGEDQLLQKVVSSKICDLVEGLMVTSCELCQE